MSVENRQPSAVGIIAEYNPFHNGHAYQIRKAKELSGATYCIVAMSGDFVQRGAPAIFNKHTRTQMALLAGADLVLEMPPYFAVSSAEDFAACGVAMLDRLGVVTHLCFGSECGAIEPLQQAAELLFEEPAVLSAYLRDYVKQGFTYPQAREQAVLQYLRTTGDISGAESLGEYLSAPNNILGIEYCKALLRRNSSMIPITVKRQGHGYHDTSLDQDFGSATAIRQELQNLHSADADLRILPSLLEESELLKQIPEKLRTLLINARPLFADDFSTLLSYRLLELQAQGAPFHQYFDVSDDLAKRMQKQLLEFTSFDDKVSQLKTRQFTYTRISRCLMHLLLQMTESEYNSRKEQDYVSYIRILGFRRESADILSAIKKHCSLPLITKTADASKRLDEAAYQQFQHDIFCSHVYQSVYAQKYNEQLRNEFTQPLILL